MKKEVLTVVDDEKKEELVDENAVMPNTTF